MKTLLAAAFMLVHFPQLTFEQDQWAQNLYNKGGINCCSNAEGAAVKDPDWGIEDGKYWVYLHGGRRVVPPMAVVEMSNPTNTALVWFFFEGGQPVIKCFLPGHLTSDVEEPQNDLRLRTHRS